MTQRGSVALVVLLLVALSAGGVYLYSKGKLGLNTYPKNDPYSGYTLNTQVNPTASGENATLTTSSDISLNLTSPLSGVTLSSGRVVIKGTTSPNAEVFVNEASTNADAKGNFSLTVTLDEGENTLIITANDEEGNVAEQTLSVNVQTFQ